MLRGADIGSDHHLLMAKVRLKIAKVRKGESGRVRFEVSKLKDFKVKSAFKLALHHKNTMNMARMRKQKGDTNKRYQELNREVKRRCR